MPNTTWATVFRGPIRAAAIQLFKTPDFLRKNSGLNGCAGPFSWLPDCSIGREVIRHEKAHRWTHSPKKPNILVIWGDAVLSIFWVPSAFAHHAT